MSYRSSSTTSALASSQKVHSERHKQILKQLLKEDANKLCCDCKLSKNPRWASWSLGCFICIRCSGIHRSMGTHISKVKSVDLDAWTDDQIENMIKWGNENCNLYWEDKLPDGYIPDQGKIENFIRTKYDLKKWTSSKTVPDPLTLKKKATSTTTTTTKPTKKSNLLDDDFGSFTSTKETPPPPPSKRTHSFPSTPQPQSQQIPIQQPPINQIQSAQSTGGSINSNNRPDLKKSILSLYASPSSSNSFIQQQQQQQQQQRQQSNQQVNHLSGSLAGLNFNSSPSLSNTNPSSSNSLNRSNNSWNNEWTGSQQSLKSSTNNINVNGIDDDLFKNVWN
ncbi:unnamed protein product [Candida verbasci]|uniref:Arf-GAP domain-containing protein n=1 Tax=Candida verbasci TaxID=1227364 RepID=A0A9W4TZ86_9ASCO|nr:unnamed protein product [Candida verbasci]